MKKSLPYHTGRATGRRPARPRRLFLRGLPLLAMLLAAYACIREENTETNTGSAGDREIVLRMAVPGAYTGTRAIGETQENTISTVDVLAFKIDGTSETYDYSAVGKAVVGNTPGAITQRFTVTLRTATYPQRFVVIANAHTEVGRLIGSSTWEGVDKETMLAGLEFDLPAGANRWNAAGAANYTAIPMWSESGEETITASSTQLSGSLSLMRMIARIDVQLDTQVAGLTDKFKLKSVHLYN